MEFFRRATNPWGEEILRGLSWDLAWFAIAAALLACAAYTIYVKLYPDSSVGLGKWGRLAARLPEQIIRHKLAARLSHWVMAAAVVALLVTSFFPIAGIQFPWVTIHWIAGFLFGAYLVYHTLHALARRSMRSMWIGHEDLQSAWAWVKRLGHGSGARQNPGKWGVENKVFHHLVALAGVAVIATGVLMTLRIQTPFWEPDPYLLSDRTWGFVFVLHGLSAVAFIGLFMVHVYFAIRPEKRWITWSMFHGKISRQDYLRHHDPRRWPVVAEPVLEGAEAEAPPVIATTER